MKTSHKTISLLLGLTLMGCDSQPSGLLQQRIAELEAECAAARKHADQLQVKLDAKETAPTSTPASTPAKIEELHNDDAKNRVAAAALLLAESLREKVKPGMLQAYEEAAWAGYRVEKAGESRGVAVPFFRDSQGQWICGWSERQITEALEGQPSPAVSPTSPAISPPSPPPAPSPASYPGGLTADRPATPAPPRTPPPMPTPAPAPAPPVSQPRASTTGASKTFFVDPATGKLYKIKPDGTREAVPEAR